MANYVSLTKDEFESILPNPEVVEHPTAKEIIYKIKTPRENLAVVIYSSVDKFSNVTRDVGEDAIRVVFWDDKNNHPLGKGKRIYRVTSKASVQDRIKKTIDKFMTESKTVVLIDWDYVGAVLKCSTGNFSQSLLSQLQERKSLSPKQLDYVIGKTTPKGGVTLEQALKNRGWKYDPIFEDDTTPEIEDTLLEDMETAFDSLVNNYQDYVIQNDNVELVSTEGYPYKFPLFNPVQSMVHPFRTEDVNYVVGAATSAGKTICAEIIMDEVLKAGKRVGYLSPLKSLTEEKGSDWKERFADKKITILTGDYTLSEARKQELAGSDIIVMTSEMADSRTRHFESEKNYWLKQIGLLIVDESHILTTGRGHAVESGIMRFTALNPDAKVLFLSATMPNVGELGKWLERLNGKPTRVMYSTWRPVELQIHYEEYVPVMYGHMENYSATAAVKKNKVIEIVNKKPTEKFLVFVHDKNTGKQIVSLLKHQGVEAKFHNADLDLEERKEIESSFRNREQGSLRVMVSTSTTAWGVNLPARNVIIVGIHRGLNEVDELDIIQMAGRAGRFGIDDQGHVYLIIPQGSTETWKHIFANPRPVTSVLNAHQTLAFHVLAEIQNKVITDAKSLLRWYERSLSYFQHSEFGLEDAEGLLNDLEKMEMIIKSGWLYRLTGLGKVSSWLYLSPYDVYAWKTNWDYVFTGKTKNGEFETVRALDDLATAWALTDIPSNDWGYVPKDVQRQADDMRWRLRNRGIYATDSIHFSLAAWKSLAGEELTEGTLKADARTIKYDLGRTMNALELIDTFYANWGKKDFWKTLALRISYGVPEEMIDLVRLPGIGGVRAKKLFDNNVKTLQDVASMKTSVLKELVGNIADKVQGAARKELVERGVNWNA